jgi:hypothetical protein
MSKTNRTKLTKNTHLTHDDLMAAVQAAIQELWPYVSALAAPIGVPVKKKRGDKAPSN